MQGAYKNRDFRPISRFISEMIQDRTIVTVESEYETVYNLSNGTSFNGLEWSVTQISRSQYHSTRNKSKIVQDRATRYTYNGQPIESRIWFIKRRHFQWLWMTPTPSFKVTPFFDSECLRNGTTYRHSVVEILTGTYTRPAQQCHFEWPWVTCKVLNDTKRSIARSLCDSWASFLF